MKKPPWPLAHTSASGGSSHNPFRVSRMAMKSAVRQDVRRSGRSTVFTVDRPLLLTSCLTALFIAILETRKGLWLLPPLALVWANGHGGFFMGWLVLGAYSLEPLIRLRKQRPGREDWRLWIVAAVSILISGLNPNH